MPSDDNVDLDEDGLAGPCDPDDDGDDLLDFEDSCPQNADPFEADADEDGTGDVCDEDDDDDGVLDADDNCPLKPNADQSNIDGDAFGDRCDDDDDGDGLEDGADNCSLVRYDDQAVNDSASAGVTTSACSASVPPQLAATSATSCLEARSRLIAARSSAWWKAGCSRHCARARSGAVAAACRNSALGVCLQ